MSSTTAAHAWKIAFYELIKEYFAEHEETPHVLVTFGAPANLDPDDLVAFMTLRSDQNVATIGNRSREEALELTVVISCFRGGPDSERAVSDRAYYLLGLIEEYVRKVDTTCGGTVRHCFLVGHDSDGTTPPEYREQGRVMEITARFQAFARIT